MRTRTLIIIFFIISSLAGCMKSPILDSVIPANSSTISKPTNNSNIGISMGLNLTEINKELQQHIGTALEHRTGVSVKVNFHKVIISKAEEAAIKTWHETKAAWSEGRRRAGVQACNRKIRSSSRRDCRNERNKHHDERMREYDAKKARRMEKNRRREVKGFEIKPSSGKDNYFIASARLDNINVYSKSDKLIVATKIHAKIKLNIENPFDHSKEIKGLVNTDFDISAALGANISFTKDGKIELINKQVIFTPRFYMPSILKPLNKLADKMNNKIADKIKEQVDKQIAKIEFKRIVDEKLTSFTSEVNRQISKDNIWIIPNISKIKFKITKAFASDRNMMGINLGLTFKPEVIYSEKKPDAIDKIAYDVTLTNEDSPNHIALNSTALIDLSDISEILTTKVQEEINSWLESNEDKQSAKKKWFDIDKAELLTSNGNILIVLYTAQPVNGTIVLSTKPLIDNNGHTLKFTKASLYAGTRSAVSEKTSWLLQLPLGSILEGKLAINIKPYFDKGLVKVKKEGITISKTEKLSFKDESFALKRLNASNGNLLIEVSVNAKVEIVPNNN